MDTVIDNAFYVFDGEGKYLRFHLCNITNLYQLDIEQTSDGTTIFTTIEGCGTTKQQRDELEQYGLSQLDYNRVVKVQDLQQVLMCPSEEDLVNAIENNVIGNNDFRQRDVVNANKLFGKDIATLKPKT